MSRVFSKVVPKTSKELEQFYLDTGEKLGGTSTRLADVDYRASAPTQAPAAITSVVGEMGRSLSDIEKAAAAPMRAQIDGLENQVRNLQVASMASRIDELERQIRNLQGFFHNTGELERRIASIENSARY